MKKIFLKYFFSAAIFLFLLLFLKSDVLAQERAALTIIPPKFELFGNPGGHLNEDIRVRNESDSPITYTVLLEDFTTAGEEGQVVLEEGENVSSYSLANWMELSSKEITLQPKEEKRFPFIINIPKDAEPGGHYASVLFVTAGGKVEGGASVSNRVGSLVLLRVSGNVKEEASLESFSAPKFSQHGPINFDLRVRNTGNTHISPKGTIVITDIFGKKVEELPLEGRNVLPGSTRKMTTKWDKKNILGSYTATLIAFYGQQNKSLTATTKFTVISNTALIGGFLGLFALVGFVMTLIFGRKRLAKMFSVMFKG